MLHFFESGGKKSQGEDRKMKRKKKKTGKELQIRDDTYSSQKKRREQG